MVTGNLLVQGANPRQMIGTVNTAEFFVTVTISATFIAALGWAAFTTATVGLLIGGVRRRAARRLRGEEGAGRNCCSSLVGILLTLYQPLRRLSAR